METIKKTAAMPQFTEPNSGSIVNSTDQKGDAIFCLVDPQTGKSCAEVFTVLAGNLRVVSKEAA